MATGSVSPKRGKILNIPDQTVTIGTATDGGTGTTASVAFTAGSVTTGGPVTYYTATSTPGSFTANGSSSPITVSGLSEGTAYTFKVKAGNPSGYSTAGESAASNSVTPEAPGVFESIATVVGTNSSATISFTSIPSTYKHLQVRMLAKSNGTSGSFRTPTMRINSDSGTNYSYHFLKGNGSGISVTGGAPATGMDLPSVVIDNYSPDFTNVVGAMVFDILDYASTSKNKIVKAFGGATINNTGYGPDAVTFSSGGWFSTSAVNSLTFTITGSTQVWSSSCQIALYGIKG